MTDQAAQTVGDKVKNSVAEMMKGALMFLTIIAIGKGVFFLLQLAREQSL